MLEIQVEQKKHQYNVYFKLPKQGAYRTNNSWDKINLNLPSPDGKRAGYT